MTCLPDLLRQAPRFVPIIRPVPEYAASEELRIRYDAMKRAFGVPWIGVVAMAHAHHRNFYDAIWKGLEPITRSRATICRCWRTKL